MRKIAEYPPGKDTLAVESWLKGEGISFEMKSLHLPYAGFGYALYVSEDDFERTKEFVFNAYDEGSSIVSCPNCSSNLVEAIDEKGGLLNFLILPIEFRFITIARRGKPFRCNQCSNEFRLNSNKAVDSMSASAPIEAP